MFSSSCIMDDPWQMNKIGYFPLSTCICDPLPRLKAAWGVTGCRWRERYASSRGKNQFLFLSLYFNLHLYWVAGPWCGKGVVVEGMLVVAAEGTSFWSNMASPASGNMAGAVPLRLTRWDSCCSSTGGRMLASKAVTHLNKGDPRVKGVTNSEGIEGTTMRINPKAQRQFWAAWACPQKVSQTINKWPRG